MNIATYALPERARALFLIFFVGLVGCTLPRPASTPVVYDFGPGALQPASAAGTALAPIEISTLQASSALAGGAVLYRLSYADAQALQPYTLARWSMPPAQLIDQRLRAHLSLRRPVLTTGELLQAKAPQRSASMPPPTDWQAQPPLAQPLLNLRLTLEEFSQLFASPSQSSGLLRLRATLTLRQPSHDTLLAQRSFIVQHSASAADASAGVRALTAATDQAIGEIEQWLAQAEAAAGPP